MAFISYLFLEDENKKSQQLHWKPGEKTAFKDLKTEFLEAMLNHDDTDLDNKSNNTASKCEMACSM